MGQHELEAALRREGEQKAREIWRSAESEAGRLRSETSAVHDRQKHDQQLRQNMDVAAILNSARTMALKNAQRTRLIAEKALADRLKLLAEKMLEALGIQGGESLFFALVDEIPEHQWCKVEVHPRDKELASSRFTAAEVMTSERISGGLKVEGVEGRVVIINSLEKRLEHLWPEILPAMLTEFRHEKSNNEAVS